jgi:hypothetical protein
MLLDLFLFELLLAHSKVSSSYLIILGNLVNSGTKECDTIFMEKNVTLLRIISNHTPAHRFCAFLLFQMLFFSLPTICCNDPSSNILS